MTKPMHVEKGLIYLVFEKSSLTANVPRELTRLGCLEGNFISIKALCHQLLDQLKALAVEPIAADSTTALQIIEHPRRDHSNIR